jgi:hypothetical protein
MEHFKRGMINLGAFFVLGATFGITNVWIWSFYAFKMNALLESCKFFAWSSSLCITLLLKFKVIDNDNKNRG